MPKLKAGTLIDSPADDDAITAAALTDADNPPLTEARLAQMRLVQRGRPVTERPRKLISLRVDPDVLAYYKSLGKGWQSRMNEALAAYQRNHEGR